MSAERLRELNDKHILTFPEIIEHNKLLERKAQANQREEEKQALLAKEREGKMPFALTFREGNIYQEPSEMDVRTKEIWAADPIEAAELACNYMIRKERNNLTGVRITDSTSARLNVIGGVQPDDKDPIWVNPYSIAPSQQLDGGPSNFAETIAKLLTGQNVNIENGRIKFEPPTE